MGMSGRMRMNLNKLQIHFHFHFVSHSKKTEVMFEFQKLTIFLKAKFFYISSKANLSKTKIEK
jgi:hypothetical protein